jgi:hypothetical protein
MGRTEHEGPSVPLGTDSGGVARMALPSERQLIASLPLPVLGKAKCREGEAPLSQATFSWADCGAQPVPATPPELEAR